jgi:hypothetical protein
MSVGSPRHHTKVEVTKGTLKEKKEAITLNTAVGVAS